MSVTVRPPALPCRARLTLRRCCTGRRPKAGELTTAEIETAARRHRDVKYEKDVIRCAPSLIPELRLPRSSRSPTESTSGRYRDSRAQLLAVGPQRRDATCGGSRREPPGAHPPGGRLRQPWSCRQHPKGILGATLFCR